MTAVAAAGGRGGFPMGVLALLLGLVTLGLAMSPMGKVVIQEAGEVARTASNQPDGGLYENLLPERLGHEVEKAQRVGVRPIRAGGPGFEAVVNEGRIKYVILQDGDLLVAPHTAQGVEISHAVLSGGRPVLAAGEADIAAAGGRFVGLRIVPHSGHYKPAPGSVELAKTAFKAVGVTF